MVVDLFKYHDFSVEIVYTIFNNWNNIMIVHLKVVLNI